jgi:hypothetical protein
VFGDDSNIYFPSTIVSHSLLRTSSPLYNGIRLYVLEHSDYISEKVRYITTCGSGATSERTGTERVREEFQSMECTRSFVLDLRERTSFPIPGGSRPISCIDSRRSDVYTIFEVHLACHGLNFPIQDWYVMVHIYELRPITADSGARASRSHYACAIPFFDVLSSMCEPRPSMGVFHSWQERWSFRDVASLRILKIEYIEAASCPIIPLLTNESR